MNNIKNKLVIFLKKTYIRYIIFVLFGFLIGWLVFVGFVTKKEFKKYYFSSGNIQIETKNTLACSSISESSVSTYNNKVYSEANKSPLDKFSVGIDLLNKKLFFIFSTNRKYTSPEILKLYKLRWKIESFFKILKSYLGLSVLNRNDIDYVEERINLSLSGFFIVQEMSFEIKSSFYQTLKLLKSGELNELFDKTYKSVCKYFSYCV